MIIRLNKQQKRDFVDKGLLKILVSNGDNTHLWCFTGIRMVCKVARLFPGDFFLIQWE